MENAINETEIEARARYQRAIYKRHECDPHDVELRKHFDQIIASYEATHQGQKRMLTRAIGKELQGRSLA